MMRLFRPRAGLDEGGTDTAYRVEGNIQRVGFWTRKMNVLVDYLGTETTLTKTWSAAWTLQTKVVTRGEELELREVDPEDPKHGPRVVDTPLDFSCRADSGVRHGSG